MNQIGFIYHYNFGLHGYKMHLKYATKFTTIIHRLSISSRSVISRRFE